MTLINHYKNKLITILVLAAFSVVVSGCQKYGSVSPKTYEIAKSLYSICNRQDKQRLPSIEKIVTQSLETADLSNSEAKWLMAIVDKANSNQWEQAMLDARTIMQEQIH